jgi:hypothetical protein
LRIAINSDTYATFVNCGSQNTKKSLVVGNPNIPEVDLKGLRMTFLLG